MGSNLLWLGKRLLDFWPLLLTGLYLSASMAVTVHAVLRRRDTRAVIGWVGLAWLAPLLGSMAYIALGINRIHRKAATLKIAEVWEREVVLPHTKDDLARREEGLTQYPNLNGLAMLMRRLSRNELSPGSEVRPLINGDEAYPEMLAAIDQAQRTVSLLSYIFDSDRAGEQFLQALIRAQNRGVEVRVLVDAVGARYSKVNIVPRLKMAGLKAEPFLPTRIPRFYYANLRNHRKILVVDGHVGFTGGTNIREGHCLAMKPEYPVQCLHFRLEGPVVRHLQEAFAVDWAFVSGESIGGPDWFPEPRRAGSAWARGIAHGPDEDFEKMPMALLGALAAATKSVRIVTPYFLPEAPLIHALNVAALRGVRVEIIMPSQNNVPPVHWASQATWWQLLEPGCRIYLSAPPFDHTKLLVVDEVWSLVGSTNWDQRSLRLNFEFNVECYDSQLAQRLGTIIDEKIANSHEVTLEEVNARSVPIQLRDGLARLLSPYL